MEAERSDEAAVLVLVLHAEEVEAAVDEHQVAQVRVSSSGDVCGAVWDRCLEPPPDVGIVFVVFVRDAPSGVLDVGGVAAAADDNVWGVEIVGVADDLLCDFRGKREELR